MTWLATSKPKVSYRLCSHRIGCCSPLKKCSFPEQKIDFVIVSQRNQDTWPRLLIWTLMGDKCDFRPTSSPRASLAIWTPGWLCSLVSEVPAPQALPSPVAPGSPSPVEPPPLAPPALWTHCGPFPTASPSTSGLRSSNAVRLQEECSFSLEGVYQVLYPEGLKAGDKS